MPTFEVPLDGDLGRVAAAVCGAVTEGGVVALRGPIGAGKTALVRACAETLGVREPVSSPTFALAHRYGGERSVAHLDLYRLEQQPTRDVSDLAAEIDEAGIAFVEWPELGGDWLPAPSAEVSIEVLPDGTRRFAISAPG